MPFDSANDDRRFGGTKTLYGPGHFDNIKNAHCIVIGIGGVGSWAAEALARTGIGQISLIDLDVVSESNINRQLIASTDTLGDSKIAVMGQRIHAINPTCHLQLIDELISPDNIADFLPSKSDVQAQRQQGRRIIVLDCVDDIHAKTAIALHCRFNKLKLVTAGGAGGKTDPKTLTISDLKDVHQDPLLAKLRQNLRKHGINSDLKGRFEVKCVYSNQPPITNKQCHNRLACGGYGSAVVVTCTMAMLMVSQSLEWLDE